MSASEEETAKLPPVLHINRTPSVITLRDRDLIFFYPDTVGEYAYASPCPTDEQFSLKSRFDIAAWEYQAPTSEYPAKGERALVWYRLNQSGEIINGGRFLYFVDSSFTPTSSSSAAPAPLKLFREVISPSFSFEADSNALTMMFWTNCSSAQTIGSPLNMSSVIKINEDEFDQSLTKYKNCYKVLCISTGTIRHMYTQGGFACRNEFYTSYGHRDSEMVADIVPVMNAPIVVDNWDLKQTDLDQDDVENDGLVPIVDFIRTAGGSGVAEDCKNSNPKDLSYSGSHSDSARGSNFTWNRDDTADSPPNYEGVKVTVQVGMSYNPSGAIKVWLQDLQFDSCGKLVSVGEERSAELDTPSDC